MCQNFIRDFLEKLTQFRRPPVAKSAVSRRYPKPELFDNRSDAKHWHSSSVEDTVGIHTVNLTHNCPTTFVKYLGLFS